MEDRIDIIIHSSKNNKKKVINLKMKYVKIFCILIAIFFSFSIISCFLNVFFIHKYFVLNSNLQQKEKRLEVAITLNKKYKEKLIKIKNNLLKLEEYLTKRGVIRKNKDALGGLSKFKVNKLSYESYLDFLITRSEELLYQLKITPTGFPVKGRITSFLGWRKNPFGKGYEYHTGIDIKAPYGAPVHATADGVVIYAGWYGEYGKVVIIRHPSGYKTLYAHLSRIKVRCRQKVKAGQVIGYIGSTGRSTGPHLHYEVRLGHRYLNPLKFIVWK